MARPGLTSFTQTHKHTTICLASPQRGHESTPECVLPNTSSKERYPGGFTASLGFSDIQQRADILPAALPAGQKDRPLGFPRPTLNLSPAKVQTSEKAFCRLYGHTSPREHPRCRPGCQSVPATSASVRRNTQQAGPQYWGRELWFEGA